MGQPFEDRHRDSLARALVLLQRYSVDISEIAIQSLGSRDIENRDVQLILTVHHGGPLTPTESAARMAAPRSTVSRAMNRLEGAGLAVRIPSERDRRSVVIALTPKGRRRVTAFAMRLGDYFTAGEPLLKESLDLLDAPTPDHDLVGAADPVAATEALSRAGARYVDEVVQVLEPFGISEFSDRFTIALLHLRGSQRPTQIADELGLTPSGTSGVLTRLEEQGVITRRHDLTPGDRRAVIVELTPRGEEAVQRELDVFERHAPAIVHALALTWRTAS
jgi:DNA-binding MarR family transcriptional regulator